MDIAKVNALIAALEKSSLGSMTYEEDGFRLSLSKGDGGAAPIPVPGKTAEVIAPSGAATATPADEDIVYVTAPIVGSVYRAKEPGGPPIASVGDKVRRGEPICLIEAMKMFNEIIAPCDGIIQKIMFDDGQLAEYGMQLMVIEPGV